MSIDTGVDKEDSGFYYYITVITVIAILLNYYSAIKRNERVPFSETWIGLKTVI